MSFGNPYDYPELTNHPLFPGRRRETEEERDARDWHEANEGDCRRKERDDDDNQKGD